MDLPVNDQFELFTRVLADCERELRRKTAETTAVTQSLSAVEDGVDADYEVPSVDVVIGSNSDEGDEDEDLDPSAIASALPGTINQIPIRQPAPVRAPHLRQTVKHQKFVEEPIDSKHVTDLPGIGLRAAARLHDAGFDHVSTYLIIVAT